MTYDKVKALYCYKCEEKTKHNLISKDKVFNGFARVWMALVSFGTSEINNNIGASYECSVCGKIREV